MSLPNTGPNNYSKMADHCLSNYDQIAKCDKGNYLYVKEKGELGLQRVDQNTTYGSLSASVGKTWTNVMGKGGADWESVYKTIHSVNNEMQELIMQIDFTDTSQVSKLKIKEIDIKLQQSNEALKKISMLYQEQGQSQWSGAQKKKAAAQSYAELAERANSLHLEIDRRLKNAKEQASRDIPDMENDPDPDSDIAVTAFESLTGTVRIEGLSDTELNSIAEWELLDRPIETKNDEPLFKVYSQLKLMLDFLKRAPESLSIDTLKTWAKQINAEIRDGHSNEKNVKLQQAYDQVMKDIAEREQRCNQFIEDLEIAGEDSKKILVAIGKLDRRVVDELEIKRILKEKLSKTHYAMALLIKAETDGIQADNNLTGEGVPKEEIRGCVLLLHQQLSSFLTDALLNDSFSENREMIRNLTDILWKADHQIQTSGLEIGDIMIQTTLVSAYQQLVKSYIAESNANQAIYCLEQIQQTPIMAAHPLGDISRVVKDANEASTVWFHVNSTTIRRRNVRVQMKSIQTKDKKETLLCLSCTLPTGERDQLGKYFEFLKSNGLLEKHNISMENSNALYQALDFTDKTYKSNTYVNTGDAYTFKDSSGKISVTVGSDEQKWNTYKKISIQMDPSVQAQDLYSFLSILGLPTMMMQSRQEDIYNENLARLTHALYPQEIAGLPTPEETLRKAHAKNKVSDLQDRASKMRLKDVGKGRMEYVDSQAIKEFWLAGGRGFAGTLGHGGVTLNPREFLTQGFFKKQSIDNAATTLGHILKGGLSSTFERFEMGIIGAGNAPDENIETGSADQVFTRPLTDNQFDSRHDWSNYAIEGNILILMDARLAERLPYGYSRDRAGLKNPRHKSRKTIRMAQKELPEKGLTGDLMKGRNTLSEICSRQRVSDLTLPTAEVMFEDVIGTDYIYGAVVAIEEQKQQVIEILNNMGISEINGVPLNDAIYVGKLSEEMIKNIYQG